MKKTLLMTMLAIAGAVTVLAQGASEKAKPAAAKATLSLADARGQIDKVVESPAQMKEIMKQLSAEDQRQFLAEVNKAIDSMPASLEEKTATYLNINHAALTAAQKGNVTALLAEVYATVPPVALTVINERFAADLLSRSANPSKVYTDDQYTNVVISAMKVINERTEETDNGSTRSAFAILMFLRASNMQGEKLEALKEALIDTLKHDDAKELARDEWIPSALGIDGREAGYEPLLASADAGRRPDFAYVLVIAGPQHLEPILADIIGKNTEQQVFIRTRTPVLDAVQNPLIHEIPYLDSEVFGADLATPGDGNPNAKPRPQPRPQPEPGPYRWQYL